MSFLLLLCLTPMRDPLACGEVFSASVRYVELTDVLVVGQWVQGGGRRYFSPCWNWVSCVIQQKWRACGEVLLLHRQCGWLNPVIRTWTLDLTHICSPGLGWSLSALWSLRLCHCFRLAVTTRQTCTSWIVRNASLPTLHKKQYRPGG